jgi:hypothetical protein
MKNNLTPGSARLDQETARTLDEDYGKHVKIYTDGSKMGDKEVYAIVIAHNQEKNLTSKYGVRYEQSAIIGLI